MDARPDWPQGHQQGRSLLDRRLAAHDAALKLEEGPSLEDARASFNPKVADWAPSKVQNDDDPTDDQAGAGTGTGTGTDTDPEPRAASRPKRTTAQQVSNNAAQKRYRDRRKARSCQLEHQVDELTGQLKKMASARRQSDQSNRHLQKQISSLQQDLDSTRKERDTCEADRAATPHAFNFRQNRSQLSDPATPAGDREARGGRDARGSVDAGKSCRSSEETVLSRALDPMDVQPGSLAELQGAASDQLMPQNSLSRFLEALKGDADPLDGVDSLDQLMAAQSHDGGPEGSRQPHARSGSS